MGQSTITITRYGDFNRTEKFFDSLKHSFSINDLEKYGKRGVEYLSEATPKDTGLTSKSWIYEIRPEENGVVIVWKNTNIQNGVEVAMLIQYGHATRNDGYVEGIDYINPALNEVFEEMQEQARKEVNGTL
ncbi:MAG: HK97 gp10 family phage protein [Pseudobutyrivibrio sp.]|nr:HK97 gp10 family phage protein [Pseudobutyrivibrio sp.]